MVCKNICLLQYYCNVSECDFMWEGVKFLKAAHVNGLQTVTRIQLLLSHCFTTLKYNNIFIDIDILDFQK